MKVNVELDCTPQEARELLGLPDVSKVNDMYIDGLAKAMKGVGNVDQLQQLATQIAPMGQMGMKFFQSLMESAAAGGTKGGSAGKKGSD